MNTNLFITCLVAIASQAQAVTQTYSLVMGYSLDTKIHAVARNRSSTRC